MSPKGRAAALVGVVVLLAAATVYLLTLTPTVPFWDSGEFIAVANILGVPHPPGTPFFVMLARVATLIPWATIAQRVNALSAISAALAVWLTYLSTLRLLRLSQRGEGAAVVEPQPWHEWVAIASAAVGALMIAFSDAFWENSIEAEVYQMMSLAQILVFWLGLRWWESHDRKPTVGPLLLATYVMWLSVGLHLGVGIMGIPLIVLVFLVDRQVAVLFLMPFLSLIRVPNGLENTVGAMILLSIATNIVLAWRRKLPGIVVIAGGLLAIPGLIVAFSDANFTPFKAVLTGLSLVGPMVWLSLRHREGRVLLLSLFLMVVGYSTHIYLPIRAAQHPAVNEGAPATWDKMRDLLERKQYGEMHLMPRRGKFIETQLDKEFWRYFRRQWPLFPTQRLWGALLPLALGLVGGYWQYRREKRSFVYTFVFLGLSTAGMIVFLNFSDHEVRDRDYFFQSGFHAYAMWIGLGMAFAVQWIRESFEAAPAQRLATAAATALLGLQPVLLCVNLWHSHDRSRNFIARDYAYNMLAGLKPNSFMFTNGDNDTFPLWYIQQVEGFRKDVRIVNLSLLNTDWYIRQLRDEEPKVPIKLDDRAIDMLAPGAFQDEKGNIVYTNEFMVHHLLEQAKRDTGWVKQPYFAVTVPNQYGFEPYLRQEGIVQEVMRDSLQAGFDEPATRHALYDVYKYRGLLTDDGTWDPKVYKDDNAQNLSRNYAFAHMQLALYYRRQHAYPRAIAEMERVERMFPDWVEIQDPIAGGIYLASGDTAKAWQFYERMAKRVPGSATAQYYYGVALGYQNRNKDALGAFRLSRRLDPNFADAYYAEFGTLWDLGKYEEAVGVLEEWVNSHPNDPEGHARLEEARSKLKGMGGGASPLPAPPYSGSH
jgi:tetratricopeptide (TPR) repeat protein